jgi:hypothetical protein
MDARELRLIFKTVKLLEIAPHCMDRESSPFGTLSFSCFESGGVDTIKTCGKAIGKNEIGNGGYENGVENEWDLWDLLIEHPYVPIDIVVAVHRYCTSCRSRGF